MKTLKITEKILLQHYEGVCNDGVTARSRMGSCVVSWSYRMAADGQYCVITSRRSEADLIMLESGRVGIIPLDRSPDVVMIARALEHEENCEATCGERIYDWGGGVCD
jgi:hypothetical protein